MKIRLTSNNIITDPNFSIYNPNTNCPTGWFATGGSNVGSYFNLTAPAVIYCANTFNFITEMSNPYDYIKVYKEASVEGVGTYKLSITEDAKTLVNGRFYNYTIEATEAEIVANGLNQEFVSGTELNIKELGVFFQMETELLRNPNYTENLSVTPLIVKNKNSKSLLTSEVYQPHSAQLDFYLCYEESRAVQAFFNTCIAYGVGFGVEIEQTTTDSEAWGVGLWGEQVWGYDEPIDNKYYTKKYNMDLDSCTFLEEPVNGSISIPVKLQKSEVGYGKY